MIDKKISFLKYYDDIVEKYKYPEEDKEQLAHMAEFIINSQVEDDIDDYLIDNNSHIVQRLKDKIKYKIVLVVGTGTGREVKVLKELGASDIVGLTLGTKNQKFAKEQLGIDIDIQDAHILPYPEGIFDIIVALNVVEHMWGPLFFLLESHRILKDNGLICIKTPASKDFTGDSWLHHILCPTPRQLYGLLIKTGFKPVHYNGQDLDMKYEDNPNWFDDVEHEVYMEAIRMDPKVLYRQDLYKYYKGIK